MTRSNHLEIFLLVLINVSLVIVVVNAQREPGMFNWDMVPSNLPNSRAYHNAIATDGMVFVIGGCEVSGDTLSGGCPSTTAISIWNTRTQMWIDADLGSPIDLISYGGTFAFACTSEQSDPVIYIAPAGSGRLPYSSDTQQLLTSYYALTWPPGALENASSVALMECDFKMNVARYAATWFSFNDYIYIVGGVDATTLAPALSFEQHAMCCDSLGNCPEHADVIFARGSFAPEILSIVNASITSAITYGYLGAVQAMGQIQMIVLESSSQSCRNQFLIGTVIIFRSVRLLFNMGSMSLSILRCDESVIVTVIPPPFGSSQTTASATSTPIPLSTAIPTSSNTTLPTNTTAVPTHNTTIPLSTTNADLSLPQRRLNGKRNSKRLLGARSAAMDPTLAKSLFFSDHARDHYRYYKADGTTLRSNVEHNQSVRTAAVVAATEVITSVFSVNPNVVAVFDLLIVPLNASTFLACSLFGGCEMATPPFHILSGSSLVVVAGKVWGTGGLFADSFPADVVSINLVVAPSEALYIKPNINYVQPNNSLIEWMCDPESLLCNTALGTVNPATDAGCVFAYDEVNSFSPSPGVTVINSSNPAPINMYFCVSRPMCVPPPVYNLTYCTRKQDLDPSLCINKDQCPYTDQTGATYCCVRNPNDPSITIVAVQVLTPQSILVVPYAPTQSAGGNSNWLYTNVMLVLGGIFGVAGVLLIIVLVLMLRYWTLLKRSKALDHAELGTSVSLNTDIQGKGGDVASAATGRYGATAASISTDASKNRASKHRSSKSSLKRQAVYLADYRIVDVIGEGTYGVVLKGIRRHDRQTVAIKFMVCKSDADRQKAMQEYRLVKKFQGHPHIVQISDLFINWEEEDHNALGLHGSIAGPLLGASDTFRSDMDLSGSMGAEELKVVLKSPRFVCIVLEYFPAGDLRAFVQLYPEPVIPERVSIKILCQIADALQYLHSLTPAVAHRDLKPDNVLVDAKLNRVLLTDFGLAAEMAEGKALARAGTPLYLAPETVAGKGGVEADIWALGCVAYGLATRRVSHENARVLFRELKEEGVAESMRSEMRHYSAEYASLTLSLLALDPSKRPTASHVMSVCVSMGADDNSVQIMPAKQMEALILKGLLAPMPSAAAAASPISPMNRSASKKK